MAHLRITRDLFNEGNCFRAMLRNGYAPVVKSIHYSLQFCNQDAVTFSQLMLMFQLKTENGLIT